jgi:hypothetical protein
MEPELQGAIKQGARIGAGSQNWSRVPELEQGKNWRRASELEPGNTRRGSRTAGDGDIACQLRNREELNSGE